MKKIVKSVLDFLELSPDSPSAQWKSFVVTAHDYLSKRQKSLVSTYKIGEYKRFDWDQENSTLVFSDDDGPVVMAKVQFVGSLSTKSKMWIWSWANGTILDNAKSQIHKVKEHGETNKFKLLKKDTWHGSESDGWDMTSVSCYLLKGKGAYRTSAETGFIYMVITDINWVKDLKQKKK
ncbi:MAG: DUF6882 domain-containing protein [Marinomonas sp.]